MINVTFSSAVEGCETSAVDVGRIADVDDEYLLGLLGNTASLEATSPQLPFLDTANDRLDRRLV